MSGRVRLIEPFGAGGGPDLVARALAGPLSERWRRPVEVENHPGGGSTRAPALVAQLWYCAMYLMASTRCGISAKQLERGLSGAFANICSDALEQP